MSNYETTSWDERYAEAKKARKALPITPIAQALTAWDIAYMAKKAEFERLNKGGK